jgi:hypothetical protein
MPVTKGLGALAFVDDVTAWVIGASAGANVQRLRTAVAPKVGTLGSIRRSDISAGEGHVDSLHKTPRLAADAVPVVVKGQLTNESGHLKILGVTFDHRLRQDVHVAYVAKKSLRATLALKPLCWLRPSRARQLFISTIVTSIDCLTMSRPKIQVRFLTAFSCQTL